MNYKTCSRCHRWLPFSQYSKNNNRKDRRNGICLDCAKEVQKRWYEDHPERRKQIVHKSYLKHRTENLEYQKLYYQRKKQGQGPC